MKNMSKMLQQAQQMQAKMTTLQNELATKEIKTTSGGGMIALTMNGKKEILEIKINPECLNPSDTEILEEMVKSAVNQAIKEVESFNEKAMQKITGGLSIPGIF